ncbi:MAG: response regulator, partial [Methyloprofundus sp.]|nr:response regulator [Methyloprofundus sp.]
MLDLKAKKILLIEDYPVMRKAIRDMLYSLDVITLIEAENGQKAINAMQTHKFDIVLCDYNLGEGKNGLQVLEEARFRKLLPSSAAFIMVTAEQLQDRVLSAMENKPDEYLTKPFTAQLLLTRLER